MSIDLIDRKIYEKEEKKREKKMISVWLIQCVNISDDYYDNDIIYLMMKMKNWTIDWLIDYLDQWK